MRRAEEMAARRHAGDGVEPQFGLEEVEGAQDLHHVLKDLHILNDLLETRRQRAFEPAGGVIDEVRPAQNRPQVAIAVS